MVSILENRAYIVEREVDEASYKVDAHMAGNGNIFASALTLDFIGAYGEISCGLLDDYIGGGYECTHTDNILHGSVYGLNGDFSVDYLASFAWKLMFLRMPSI